MNWPRLLLFTFHSVNDSMIVYHDQSFMMWFDQNTKFRVGEIAEIWDVTDMNFHDMKTPYLDNESPYPLVFMIETLDDLINLGLIGKPYTYLEWERLSKIEKILS